MDLLSLTGSLDAVVDPIIVLAFDGWTDAGRGGTLAAERLRELWPSEPVGRFDGDRLYDYRDRRPSLTIDEGVLGDPEWPSLTLHRIDLRTTHLLLIEGNEPDLSWRALCADVSELALVTGATRYVGFGAVPAPVPHTRPVLVTTTSNRPDLVSRIGAPHVRLVVPASCQVVVETALRDAGLLTLGLWARIPHYVAGEYPAAAAAVLRAFADYVEVDIDTSDLTSAALEHRDQLDLAARASDEIREHIERLERGYDEDVTGLSAFMDLPTGDEIAAELERFLRRQDRS